MLWKVSDSWESVIASNWKLLGHNGMRCSVMESGGMISKVLQYCEK